MSDIKKQVTHRCCPSCGYLITQEQVDLIRIVIECPKCEKYNINKFQPLNMNKLDKQA